ncbi:MAG: DNA-binding protein YbiB [Methylobacillus sp.]|jgi:anthranilate phosphoribosyltransferase|nr:DNA-binding protein YbiB [Methylobacillus sp.]
MELVEIIKEVARGKDGATDLAQDTAYALYAAMLRGEISDLELGALLIAFRIKGESDEEMLGFYRAMQDALPHLQAPADKPLPVVIPSYNGARRQGNLTPLLALLLARQGVPVLVHGVTHDPKRVVSAEVFTELGITPCHSADEAQRRLNAGEIAFLPIEIMSPGMDKLLQLRWRLGLRNSTHTLVKLADPFYGKSVRINSVTHPEYLAKSSTFLKASGAHAFLLRGTEGEVYANPKRCPEICYFNAGEGRVLVPAEEGSIAEVPDLPETMDVGTTASWIRRALTGETPIPRPIALQVAACLYACGVTEKLPV